LDLSDYSASATAFHTERRKMYRKPQSPTKCTAPPRPLSPTIIAAALRELEGSDTQKLNGEDREAALAIGAAQRLADSAAREAKTAARDAIVASLATQADVDVYYAAEVAETAADVAAEGAKMAFEEEFELLRGLVAELEAARNANNP
jgi:hypothetical protein